MGFSLWWLLLQNTGFRHAGSVASDCRLSSCSSWSLEHELSSCGSRGLKSASISSSAMSQVTLCDPMDYSPTGCSVHGILQARILKLVAIPFSRGSSWPRDWTRVSCIAGRLFIIWVSRGAICHLSYLLSICWVILNLTLWKLREIALLTFSQGMLPLRELTAEKPFHGSKGYFSKWQLRKTG